jgi:tRNA threonylcarbamoyladenosine biosynthesis protein TsaB
MLTLAIDTAANFCSACVWDEAADRVLAAEERDIGRGHAEQLMDVVAAVMDASGHGYPDLGRVAVAVGPGSFTGIRVGVAAARGFGLALKIPVVGVTTLEALARDARDAGSGPEAVTVAVTGGRGQIFMQSFDTDGTPVAEPRAVADEDAAGEVPPSTMLFAGNAATAIAQNVNEAGRVVRTVLDRATGSIGTIAKLAAHSERTPVPLYLRGADAKPQSGFALQRIEPDTKAKSA